MLDAMHDAVVDAVVTAKSTGQVLVVRQAAERIVIAAGGADDNMMDLVCRSLIEEGARRGAPMEFSRHPEPAE